MSAAAPIAAPAPAVAGHGITATAYQLTSGESLVRIQGDAREAHIETHTIILLDLSGSMNDGGKLFSVTRSLHFMLDLMMPTDRLSLVTFENDAKVRFSRLALTAENKEAVRITLGRLVANGGTNLSAGIVRSRECLFVPTDVGARMKQSILLLTDGHANVGIYDPPSVLRHVGALLADHPGLTVSTIGYGTDHNADLLSQIATQGSGSYNVVSNIEDVATVFGDILGGIQTCIAQQMKLVVPSAAVTQLTPFPIATADNATTITLGDLPAGGEHIVLLNGLTAAAGGLTLQAYETEAGRPIELALPLRTDPTAAEAAFGRLTVLRVSVAAFLNKIKNSLRTMTAATQAELRLERQALLTAIDGVGEPNPLLTLLRNELMEIEGCLTGPLRAPEMQAMTSVLTQHTSHLGACRGVRATGTSSHVPVASPAPIYMAGGGGAGAGAPASGAGAGAGPEDPFASANIFATVTQTRRATALRASASAPVYDPTTPSVTVTAAPSMSLSARSSLAAPPLAPTASAPAAASAPRSDSLTEPIVEEID